MPWKNTIIPRWKSNGKLLINLVFVEKNFLCMSNTFLHKPCGRQQKERWGRRQEGGIDHKIIFKVYQTRYNCSPFFLLLYSLFFSPSPLSWDRHLSSSTIACWLSSKQEQREVRLTKSDSLRLVRAQMPQMCYVIAHKPKRGQTQ